jgi:ribonuclease R
LSSRTSTPFPDREAVRRYIVESEVRPGLREVARAFNLKGADRARLKKLLIELARDGAIEAPRRRGGDARLPSVTVIEITEVDIDGELRARPVIWRGEGPPPAIIMAALKRGRRVVSTAALGPGDRALARLTRLAGGGYEGRVMRVIEAGPDRIIGLFRTGADGGRVHPTDRRTKSDFSVARADSAGAKDGEVVVAEASGARRLGLPEARIVERLGALDEPRTISRIAIHAHAIPVDFPEDALDQAARSRAPALGAREDLRSLPLITIDGADARDFDDAVWAAPDEDAANPGGFRLLVAIADVVHYVRHGDALDRAARERGNSVYFPDRVVPMLPEALSNNLCSLRPDEDRAVLACDMRIDATGALRAKRFTRALVRSVARLTYDEVQAAAEGSDALDEDLRAHVIAPLYDAYRALAAARAARGTLELDLPELRVVLDDTGAVEAVRPTPRYDSHRLIEECMIAANVAAAETLQQRKFPCMYRVHDHPDAAKIESLREFLNQLELHLPRGGALRSSHFNALLDAVRGTPHEHLVNLVILRTQAQAAYAPDNLGHFGLALKRYCHFTSPIRRYADLLVHRALIGALELGEGGLAKDEGADFTAIGEQISDTERRAQRAERDAKERYLTAWLVERVGAEFAARIVGVTRFGLFVALEATGAEGLIPIRSLGSEYFTHDETHHALVGRTTRYQLGEILSVRLAEADTITGGLVFELIDGPGAGTSRGAREKPRGGRGHKGKRSRRR